MPPKPDFGLSSLLGKRVVLVCERYVYIGMLSNMDSMWVLLTDASVVYETADSKIQDWSDMRPLESDWRVDISSIESFGEMKPK